MHHIPNTGKAANLYDMQRENIWEKMKCLNSITYSLIEKSYQN